MNLRSVRAAVLASAGLTLFYVVVVWWASGSFDHLVVQARQDWYWLAAIIAGFGVQVGLMSELRHRHRMQATTATAGGAGVGASAAGMVACCAHHVADLAPLVGATGAAAFLTDYRIPFMVVGIGVNAMAIGIAVRRLHHSPSAGDRRASPLAHA